MSERKEKEGVKVSDFKEIFKDLSGMVKENYLSNLKLALSLWEENQKFANAQIEQFLTTQKEYTEQLKVSSEKFFPKEVSGLWNGNYWKALDGNFDRLEGVQRDYINLVRIEEVATEVENEIEKEIQKAGEEAVFDIGAHDMHPELVKLVGKLKYRTSFSQNILNHSLEVAFLCGVMAGELGLNVKLARRAALLHDIGKALDHEVEGSHVEIGEELVRKYGEPPEIVEAVAKYHDPQPQSIWAILVQAADAISAARPGARREMYETYIKRIEDIERIASSFRGVEKCYAIQAGREIRVIVESTKVNDEEAVLLSNEIAKKIERGVTYPGQIKVTVVREIRATAYAM